MNSVNIIGRMGVEPELQKTKTGKSACKVSIGVRRNSETTDWFKCVAYETTAELIHQYVKKGDQVGISGSLYVEEYEVDGHKHFAVKIKVNSVSLIGNKTASTKPQSSDDYQVPKPSEPAPQKAVDELMLGDLDITSDDLPF